MEITQKKWYASKTIWVNALGLVAMIGQMNSGFILSPELQTLALTLINLVLRAVTREEIVW